MTTTAKSYEPHESLKAILLQAYGCRHFGTCPEAVYEPDKGLVPRGFLGATGSLQDVRIVFVFAEPGHPHARTSSPKSAKAEDIFADQIQQTFASFDGKKDRFHHHARWCLDQIWPGMPFEDQLRHVWMTEGRLCSIAKEIGPFVDKICAPTHLARQLDLLPHASVIAFGGKAHRRVKLALKTRLNRSPANVIKAWALSPPAANRRTLATASWSLAIAQAKAKTASSD